MLLAQGWTQRVAEERGNSGDISLLPAFIEQRDVREWVFLVLRGCLGICGHPVPQPTPPPGSLTAVSRTNNTILVEKWSRIEGRIVSTTQTLEPWHGAFRAWEPQPPGGLLPLPTSLRTDPTAESGVGRRAPHLLCLQPCGAAADTG